MSLRLESYSISKNGVDVHAQLSPFLKRISIQDLMGLSADTMELVFSNPDMNLNKMFAGGDVIDIVLYNTAGERFVSGSFFVDLIEGDIGDSSTLSIGMVSEPTNRPGLKKQVTYSRKKVNLKTMLEDVLKKSDMALIYRFNDSGGNPWEIELRNISYPDSTVGSIIGDMSETFGTLVKIHNNQVVFIDKNSFTGDPVVRKIDPKSIAIEGFSYQIKTFEDRDYEVRYYNPKTGKTTYDKKTNKSKLSTDNQLIKKITQKISNDVQARAIAMAVDGQQLVNVSFETMGDPVLVAGAVIEIQNLLELTGKYVIISAEHKIDNKGWVTKIEATNLF